MDELALATEVVWYIETVIDPEIICPGRILGDVFSVWFSAAGLLGIVVVSISRAMSSSE